MSIENHVCSLEMSKKLAEAGWKKETEFWWIDRQDNVKNARNKGFELCSEYDFAYYNRDAIKYPAPLATDILEELPPAFKEDDYQISMEMENECFWCVMYTNVHTQTVDYETKDKSFINALTQMWLYLKQEKIL